LDLKLGEEHMPENMKVKVLCTMWGAYALAVTVLAITTKDANNVTGFGFLTAIVLAVVTVKVVKT